MTSERRQRQVDSLLDEAAAAIRDEDWATARQRIRTVLALDPGNADALAYAEAADRARRTSPLVGLGLLAGGAFFFVGGSCTPEDYRLGRLLGERWHLPKHA